MDINYFSRTSFPLKGIYIQRTALGYFAIVKTFVLNIAYSSIWVLVLKSDSQLLQNSPDFNCLTLLGSQNIKMPQKSPKFVNNSRITQIRGWREIEHSQNRILELLHAFLIVLSVNTSLVLMTEQLLHLLSKAKLSHWFKVARMTTVSKCNLLACIASVLWSVFKRNYISF